MNLRAEGGGRGREGKAKNFCGELSSQIVKCAIFLTFRALRGGHWKMRERGVQMRHFRAIAQDLAALVLFFEIQISKWEKALKFPN